MSAPNLKRYLRAEVKLLRTHRMIRRHGYLSIGHFVLRHGRTWDVKTLRLCKKGRIRECFRNAALMALDTGLIYVEGYALSIIPTLHAWCVNRSGAVYETTWPSPGREYLGIPFAPEYLASRLEDYRVYGLIDVCERDFPIFKEDPSEWRHEQFQKKI